MGDTDWAWAAGMAHRVLGDGDGVPGRELRSTCRRRRPDVPASRKRDCAERERDPQDFCAALDACALPAGGRAQDVEERGEFLYAARSAVEGIQGIGDPDGADLGALSDRKSVV